MIRRKTKMKNKNMGSKKLKNKTENKKND